MGRRRREPGIRSRQFVSRGIMDVVTTLKDADLYMLAQMAGRDTKRSIVEKRPSKEKVQQPKNQRQAD